VLAFSGRQKVFEHVWAAPHTTQRTTCQALDDGPTDSPPPEVAIAVAGNMYYR